MKVRITKAFRWAREGIYVEDLRVGEIVEGRPADIALEEGWGVPADAPPPAEQDARPAAELAASSAPPAASPPAAAQPRQQHGRDGHRRRGR